MKRRTFTAGGLALSAAPLAALAQAPGRTYRIAVWNTAYPLPDISEDGARRYRAFFKELRRLGFVEGRNLVVERYSGLGQTERYPEIARTIVESRPDLISPNGPISARLLLGLTTTIPMVVPALTDPVSSGLVRSLARPGANLTGFTIDGGRELDSLYLQLLKEATTPAASRLCYLTSRGLLTDDRVPVLQQAASRLGVELGMIAMDRSFDPPAYAAVFADIVAMGAEGVFVSAAAEHFVNRKLIVDMVAAARLPAIYAWREFADEGGLMAYGADAADNYRKTAGYIARILNGEKVADLPVQQPTVFDFVVNLKTAKALAITLPETIMIRATEVIE
jgi:putative tryptophan/tyrosine transport system substrate-binding protein